MHNQNGAEFTKISTNSYLCVMGFPQLTGARIIISSILLLKCLKMNKRESEKMYKF